MTVVAFVPVVVAEWMRRMKSEGCPFSSLAKMMNLEFEEVTVGNKDAEDADGDLTVETDYYYWC